MAKVQIKSRVIYFMFGSVSLLAQVILIRRLLAVFYGNELTVGALFAGWMLWFGVGGLAFAGRAGRSRRPETGLAVIMFLSVFAFTASSAATWLTCRIFGISAGAMAGFGTILMAGFALSAPVCVLLGAGFNYAAASFEPGERNLIRLYLYEALGAGGAGILSLAIAGRVSAVAQILFCGMLFAAAGVILLEGRREKLVAGILSGIIFGALLLFSGRIENYLVTARWPGQEVLVEKESRYSTITVTRRGEQTSFWLDGFLEFSHPDPATVEYPIHLPLSMCPDPDRVLLVGGGLAGAGDELLKYPVSELVYVQVDGELTGLEQKYLPGYERLSKDPRVKIVSRDAWIFLRENRTRFDAMILNFSSPGTANLNRYYTREFFELAKRNLNPEGVLGLSAGGAGNYLSDAQAALLANTAKTLGQVFPKIAVLPLAQNYLVGSMRSPWVSEDPDEIMARLKTRGITTRYVREYFLAQDLSAERRQSVKERLAPFMGLAPNTSLRPSGYYLSSLLWLEQASPEQRSAIKKILSAGRAPMYVALALIFGLGLVLVFWRGVNSFAGLSIFCAGFAGIASELVLLLAFQAAYGHVFYFVGLLVSMFMAGLALGAWLFERFRPVFERRALLSMVLVLSGEAVSVLLCRAGIYLLLEIGLGPVSTLFLISALMILVAVFSALCFGCSAHLFKSKSGSGTGASAGWINGWDHFGACLGAFAVSAFMVPVLGLGFGLWFSGLLIVACLAAGLALLGSV
jgi:spermidine synthase